VHSKRAGWASAVRQVFKDEDQRLRDGLVLRYIPLVRAVAIQVHQRLPSQVELDDLLQAGVVGLLDAAKQYDLDSSETFSSYAQRRIEDSTLDYLRHLDLAPKGLRRRPNQLGKLDAYSFPTPARAKDESILTPIMLAQAMTTLPYLYQQVVLLYFGSERTEREISQALRIKYPEVAKLRKSALEKMAFALATKNTRAN